MRVFEFHNQVRLPTAIDETFEFFADAHNLERLTPPVLRFEVLTPSPIEMRIGTSDRLPSPGPWSAAPMAERDHGVGAATPLRR